MLRADRAEERRLVKEAERQLERIGIGAKERRMSDTAFRSQRGWR